MQLDAYIRVSRVAGRHGARFISPSVQREQIEHWALAHQVKLGKVFVELDESGGRPDRPLFMRTLDRVERGASGGVVVAKLDRFGRSVRHGLNAIARIEAAGGAFISVSDGLDLRTPTGKFMLREMNDYVNDRKKDLVVVARPSEPGSFSKDKTFLELVDKWDIELTLAQQSELASLPVIERGHLAAGSVQIALEAKATMTAHQKSRPRLHDELNSSHLVIHGASSHALAVGLVLVNTSETFISPGLQKGGAPVVSHHKQPAAAAGIIEKVKQIRRRTNPTEAGFDGLGIVAVDLKNDGSPVSLTTAPPAPQPGSIFYYDDMLVRIANEYDASFSSI